MDQTSTKSARLSDIPDFKGGLFQSWTFYCSHLAQSILLRANPMQSLCWPQRVLGLPTYTNMGGEKGATEKWVKPQFVTKNPVLRGIFFPK